MRHCTMHENTILTLIVASSRCSYSHIVRHSVYTLSSLRNGTGNKLVTQSVCLRRFR